MRAEIPGLDHSPQEVEKQLPLLQKHRHVGTDLRIVDDDEEVLEKQPRDRGRQDSRSYLNRRPMRMGMKP